MSYSEITFQDRNPIKRWLQQQRLVSAMKFCSQLPHTHQNILDFGAGNGEFIKFIHHYYSGSKFICYEPTPILIEEAKKNLSTFSGVRFLDDIDKISPSTIDIIFCLEVFEHLPPTETTDALNKIHTLLKPGGTVVIGVPVEIGIPALYKGFFRMSRRYGSFDANLKNVGAAIFGKPPKERPISEIAPGFKFHFEHMGFDYRNFKNILLNFFDLKKVYTSPCSTIGPKLMPEIYFIGIKTQNYLNPDD